MYSNLPVNYEGWGRKRNKHETILRINMTLIAPVNHPR